MRLLVLGLAGLLLAAPASRVRAQDQEGDGGGSMPARPQGGPSDSPASDDSASMPANPQGGPEDAQGSEGEGGAGAGADAAPAPAEVTLSDAKANVATLIESFIAQRAVDGVWTLRDKRTRQLRKLKLVKVDEKGVKPAGNARFSAPAALKDEATGQTLQASFIADFSSPEWKIVGMRLKSPASAPAPAAPAAKKR